MLQMVCVATLACHDDFELPEGAWEMEVEEWFNLWPLRLPLKVRKR